ncbi:MAG TPA: hypothetical protein VF546_24635 [Pyrinomonadaceae bacterium]|jgi:hypothetical protein
MIWKTTEGNFLVERDMAPPPFVEGGFGLPGGERYYEAAQYYEITSAGEVVKKYSAPTSYGMEDDLCVSNIHRVVGDTFYDFQWVERADYSVEPRRTEDVRLRGLEPFEGRLPFDADAVIERYEQTRSTPRR